MVGSDTPKTRAISSRGIPRSTAASTLSLRSFEYGFMPGVSHPINPHASRCRYGKDRFNRPYIFSLIHFYHEPDIWLFGGIYEVISRLPENHSHSYEVELDQRAAELMAASRFTSNVRVGMTR